MSEEIKRLLERLQTGCSVLGLDEFDEHGLAGPEALADRDTVALGGHPEDPRPGAAATAAFAAWVIVSRRSAPCLDIFRTAARRLRWTENCLRLGSSLLISSH